MASMTIISVGDAEDFNDISEQWYKGWLLNVSEDSSIVRMLREEFLPMVVNTPVEYPEHD